MSDVFNALSSPTRRQILSLLKARDMTAGDIADQLIVGKSTLSGHFNVLKSADLVTAARNGTTITYSLNTSVVEDVLAAVAGLLSNEEKETKDENDAAV